MGIFMETIRPVAHILGQQDGDLAIEGHTDPILFKFRLSMLALGDFWSPQNGLKSSCTDEHRQYIRQLYDDSDDGREWYLLCKSLSRIDMDGRLGEVSDLHTDNPTSK